MAFDFGLRKPRYRDAIAGIDNSMPDDPMTQDQLPEQTRYSPAIAGTMPPPAPPTNMQALQAEDRNPPQFQRKPMGVGHTLASAFFGRLAPADNYNGVNDYKDAMQNYNVRTKGLQNAFGDDQAVATATRQGQVDDLTRRNTESEIANRQSEINTRRAPLHNVVNDYSDALSRNDQPTIDRLKPLVGQFEDATDKSKAPAPKAAKEQLQEQISAELAKPTPDKKVIADLQGRMRAIDPMGQQRINISLDGANNRKQEADARVSRQDVRQHDKDYVVPAEGVEKSYQMMQHAYDEYTAAKAKGQNLPTGAQSMLALSTHLSTTFGNVKGARVTKDMIAHHLGARSISDSALVAVQKLTNGDVLSPDQWNAFHDLIGQSRKLSWQTATKEAKRKNIPVDFLPPDVSDSGSEDSKVINYDAKGNRTQ